MKPFRPTTRANLCVSQSVTGWPSPASERWKARSPLTASATCTLMCSLTTGPSATIPRLCRQSLNTASDRSGCQVFRSGSGNTLDSETGGSASKAPVPLTNSSGTRTGGLIRETRRMRSRNHFIDSTVGVLVFFKKIEGKQAAPDLPLNAPESAERRTCPGQSLLQSRPW